MARRISTLLCVCAVALTLVVMAASPRAQPAQSEPSLGVAPPAGQASSCEKGVDCCRYLTIPVLAGATYPAAAARLREQGAKPRRVYGTRAGVRKGLVYASLPLADERVCVGTQVWVFIGPAHDPVPPRSGQPKVPQAPDDGPAFRPQTVLEPGPSPVKPTPAPADCHGATCSEPARSVSGIGLVTAVGTAAVGGGLVASRLLRSGQGGPAPMLQAGTTQAPPRPRLRVKRDIDA